MQQIQILVVDVIDLEGGVLARTPAIGESAASAPATGLLLSLLSRHIGLLRTSGTAKAVPPATENASGPR
jgi:hypothetical protein